MTTIAEIFQTFGVEYITRFGPAMPRHHLKTINAITACRTAACGIVVYNCQGCGQVHAMFRSCGNRHCPTCQNHKTRQWLQARSARQLSGHHFMITFTVPQQLRSFIRSNQRSAYSAMFAASSLTIKAMAANDRFIGADLPGFFGVLHTWGRQLHYHPHIHYLVAGGAVSKSDGRWHPSRQDFFAPVQAMSRVFRAKLRHEFKRLGLLDAIDPIVWTHNFNVNCQAVGHSRTVVRYLAPYIFKVAICDSRIIKIDGFNVWIRYKKPQSQRWRTMTLHVMEFIRRFLQHVLPTGFMKVRYYGFMSPAATVTVEQVNTLIQLACGLACGFDVNIPKASVNEPQQPYCSHCGAPLVFRCLLRPHAPLPADYG